jgi:hypothetical protein
MKTLNSAVMAAEREDGWARLGLVGSYISNQSPFDHRTYGFKKLSDLFAAINLFEVRKQNSGSQLVVEVRRVGAAAATQAVKQPVKMPAKKVVKKAVKKAAKKAAKKAVKKPVSPTTAGAADSEPPFELSS